MASFNKVILLGNTTRECELKYTQGGTAVCEIGLAVNDKRKNAAGEWIEEAVFVDCTAWGRTAEVAAEYLPKGSPVLIDGRLKLDQWEHDGQKRSKLRVVVEKLQLLGRKPGAGGKQYSDDEAPHQGGGSKSGGGSSSDSGNSGDSGGDNYGHEEIPFMWVLPLLFSLGAALLC